MPPRSAGPLAGPAAQRARDRLGPRGVRRDVIEPRRREDDDVAVRIGLVEPGAVATELTSHITQPDAKAAAERTHATMRRLQSEDIARAVLYVVSQPPHVAVNEVLVRPTDQER